MTRPHKYNAKPVAFVIPIKAVSEANVREHWTTKAKRAKAQREAAKWFMGHAYLTRMQFKHSLVIGITRLGPWRRPMDDDNLARSMKAIRDGIADALGIDDGGPRLRWDYAQEKAREYGVRVEIVEVSP